MKSDAAEAAHVSRLVTQLALCHPAGGRTLTSAGRRVLQCTPAQCVYVGDDLRDIEAGIAAGMSTLAAAYGYVGPHGDYARWPATGVIARPADVLDWLPERVG